MTIYAADLADIKEAAHRIDGQVHRTPVLTCSTLDGLSDRQLFFKCENLQKIGAFKMRGALNAVLSLSEEDAARGVVTHSSGNFAQAVALSAKMRGVPAHIVMPVTAPEVKRQAVAGYGARIIPCPPTLEARETTTRDVMAETGATFLHPYDQPEVIAGQGTTALELMEQVADLDAVVIPLGGGGLISGMALALRELAPGVRIIAAEPAGADDAARSKRLGKLIPQTGPNTVADGLLTSLGEWTWPVVRDVVERVVVVEDEEIIAAMRLIWERMKLVVEPSAAVGLAAVLSEEGRSLDGLERIAIVLSG
ncbi:MAG: pyridoxal-phosphate dependent enzyme, partial [Myxococcota bacterium]|nr:pyridoxal-phosphate dependent enzyme [Myxococcota bacterium]